MDHQEPTTWLHQAADWAAAAAGAIFLAAIGWAKRKLSSFVPKSAFAEYRRSREDRDRQVDEKLDDIKNTVVRGLERVHQRVDGLYDGRSDLG